MRSIVIAKYTEDISWIKDLRTINIHVIDKDKNDWNAPGREAHTYLKFIVANYHSLEGAYIFCQGNPFDHCPTFLNELDHEIPGKAYPCTRDSRSEISRDKALAMDRYITILGLNVPENWEFIAGAQFRTTAEQIQKRPLRFYYKCLDLVETDPQSGYIFEGLWKFIL